MNPTPIKPTQEELDTTFAEAAIAHAQACVQTVFHQAAYLALVQRFGTGDPIATRARNDAIDAFMKEQDLARALNQMIQRRAHLEAYTRQKAQSLAQTRANLKETKT
jgi:hypothetical protein